MRKLDYVVRRTYLPDFLVVLESGKSFFIEVKGWFRPEDRTKMIAVKAYNPDLDIRLVFSNDGKLSSKSSSRYSDWCRKHGFEFAIGHIPEKWFKDEKET